MSNFYSFYPPSGGGSAANPSIGVNGITAPTSSTEVGGINPSGNLQPLQTNAAGALITTPDPTGVQHVIVDSSALPTGAATQTTLSTVSTTLGSILLDMTNGTQVTQVTGTLPLPTGASTSALQTSGNASLTSIDGKTPALGQALAAASVPVVLPAAQITALTPPTTVTVTQATGTNLHAVIDASALPTGAATETTLAAVNTKTPALGQAVKALSVPVTIASDQGAIPVSGAVLNGVTGTAAAANADAIPSTDVSSYGTLSVQVTGTFAGTLTFQGSNDNTTFFSVNYITAASATTVPSQTTTTIGLYSVPVEFRYFRLRMTAFTSGSAVGLMTALGVGVQDLGARTVIPSGGTITTVSSVTAVGSITSALPVGSNTIGNVKIAGRATANAPIYNVYSTTPITTSAYVTIVASLATPASFFDVFDSSGQAMIIATGIAGSEVIVAYIPPGGGQLNVNITSGVRISFKALTGPATSGYLLFNSWT